MTNMPYTVIIRNNATGEERPIQEDGDWDGSADFMWSEGNFACDCNRALFFYNWGPESEDRECGHEAFNIPRVILPSGEVIEFEG